MVNVQPALRELYMNGVTGVSNEGVMKLVKDQHASL